MGADVRGFYTELGVTLPDRDAPNVKVRCFTNPGAHSHDDRTPSCSVNLEHGSFYCHGCGNPGGAYDAAIAKDKTPGEAMELLRRYGFDPKDSDAWDTGRNGHGEVKATNGGGLRVTGADLSRARPPRWAWQYRILIGSLNLLMGNESVGKGTLIAWLIAGLTRGKLHGDLHGQPVGVGIIGDEDDFDDAWTPRLHAAGASLEFVKQIDRPDGGFVNVREDRDKLADVCRRHGLGVLFFDQLLDNLGAGTDDWRQKAIRDALQPLRSLARELDIATLGCLHPNKRGTTFRELMSGTVAFNAVSRSSLLLAAHPDDENTRVLVRGKGNHSRKPEPVEFRIAEHRFEANGHEFRVPLAHDFTIGDLDADELIGKDTDRDKHSSTQDALGIIEALLPKDGEWHPAKQIIEACAENGIEKHTAQRAAKRLRLAQGWTKTFPSESLWRWRDQHSDNTATPSKNDVAPVAPVAPANTPKPLLSSSDDTHDSYDLENNRDPYVVAGEKARACAKTGESVIPVELDGPPLVDGGSDDARIAELRRRYVDGEQ